MPRTVVSGSASPIFLRSWRTWTSTVRSSPYQSAPHAPSSSWRRLNARPLFSARYSNSANSRVVERDDVAVDPRLGPPGVDLDAAGREDLPGAVGARLRGAIGPAQDRLHPGDELPWRERLGHVVVRAELEPEHPVDLAVAGGEHDDGDVTRRPETAAQLESVDLAGQADVEDDQAGVPLGHRAQPVGAVVGAVDAEAGLVEVQRDQVGDVHVVLDENHGERVCHRAVSSRPLLSVGEMVVRTR